MLLLSRPFGKKLQLPSYCELVQANSIARNEDTVEHSVVPILLNIGGRDCAQKSVKFSNLASLDNIEEDGFSMAQPGYLPWIYVKTVEVSYFIMKYIPFECVITKTTVRTSSYGCILCSKDLHIRGLHLNINTFIPIRVLLLIKASSSRSNDAKLSQLITRLRILGAQNLTSIMGLNASTSRRRTRSSTDDDEGRWRWSA